MSSPSTDGRADEACVSPKNATYTVVMVRHGQSEANARFPKTYSGWEDTMLTCEGIQQAKRVGLALKNAGFKFDVGYTSLLLRTRCTLDIILEEMGQVDIPRYCSWRLNERHFGAMHGLNRNEIIKKYGEDVLNPFNAPPPMTEDHPDYAGIQESTASHKEGPAPHEFPQSESLKQTIERTVPYWHEVIVPQILSGKNVIIVGHLGNLKGLTMYLDGLPEEDVDTFTIPNAAPFLYKFDKNMKPVISMKYLSEVEMSPT